MKGIWRNDSEGSSWVWVEDISAASRLNVLMTISIRKMSSEEHEGAVKNDAELAEMESCGPDSHSKPSITGSRVVLEGTCVR